MGYLGEPSQVAAGGRPLAVAAEVGREGGEGGAVREAHFLPQLISDARRDRRVSKHRGQTKGQPAFSNCVAPDEEVDRALITG